MLYDTKLEQSFHSMFSVQSSVAKELDATTRVNAPDSLMIGSSQPTEHTRTQSPLSTAKHKTFVLLVSSHPSHEYSTPSRQRTLSVGTSLSSATNATSSPPSCVGSMVNAAEHPGRSKSDEASAVASRSCG